MRRRWSTATVLAACAALGACSGGSSEPAPTVTVTETPSPSGSAPAPEAAPGGEASQACRDALDLGSAVISQSNTLIEQFARAVQGDQAAIDALSDPATNQATVQQLSANQQQYVVLSAQCRGEEPPAS